MFVFSRIFRIPLKERMKKEVNGMSTPERNSRTPKLMNMAMGVIAVAILLFTGFLLVANYRSQVNLRNTAVDRYKYGTEQHALALGYFFNERRDLLHNLMQSRVIEAYFENRALGMSMAYGLRASLLAIHGQIKRLIQKQGRNDQPVFKSIMVVDDKGEVIVSGKDGFQVDEPGLSMIRETIKARRILPAINLYEQSFALSEAIFVRKQIVGWIVGWIDLQFLREHLVQIKGAKVSLSGALLINGHLYLEQPDIFKLWRADVDLIKQMPAGVIQHVELIHGQGGASEHLALKVPIADTPLAFIGLILKEDLFGRTAPWHIPAALASISVVLFGSLFFLWRQNINNLVLQAHLDEASKRETEIAGKNLDLESQIEKRHAIETKLRESEMRFRNLVESINDWFWEVDTNGVYTYVGPQIKTLLGYDPGQVIGKTAFDFMSPEDGRRVRAVFKALVADRCPIELLENTLVHKEGHPVVVQTSGLPVFDSQGKFLGYRGTDRDITEKLKLEDGLRQAQKMKSIGTLAGGIAHDFNNILGIMIGNAELALDDVPESNPAYRYIQEIKEAGLRAADIVKQLLSFSRKSDPKLKPINIMPIINDGLNFLRSSIPASIKIRRNISDAEAIILGDPTQINQIMMNLCINARQAMEGIGGIIEVGARKVLITDQSADSPSGLKKAEYVKLTVGDTGTGIDPKIINNIFDPYFTTKKFGQGVGMGLAVVHGIVKNHGGAITVESEVGKGAVFSIYFPMAQEKVEIQQQISQALDRGAETILFVDDEQAIVDMMAQVLGRLGYHAVTKITALEALEFFQSKSDQIDLVITDMTMPQMTGAQLFEKMKKIRPDIPVIICTGHSDLIDEESAKELGAAAYVVKPSTKQQIAKTIREVLDKRADPNVA
jgi:PAS domain S-box-containing protein